MVVLLAAGMGGWLHRATPPKQLPPGVVAKLMPERLTLDGQLRYSYPLDLDERTLAILEHPTYSTAATWWRPSRPWTSVCSSRRTTARASTRRTLCLEGGGSSITRKEPIDLAIPAGSPCRAGGCSFSAASSGCYLLYTYKCGGHYTRSFWNQQITIFATDCWAEFRGALVRTSTPVERSPEEARRRAVDMMRTAIPRLDEHLP